MARLLELHNSVCAGTLLCGKFNLTRHVCNNSNLRVQRQYSHLGPKGTAVKSSFKPGTVAWQCLHALLLHKLADPLKQFLMTSKRRVITLPIPSSLGCPQCLKGPAVDEGPPVIDVQICQ
uniref:Uncharacterized protein n=1 Tax=Bionectria ochroleuca TaxID=29856 RepID=A0A0B7KBN2_BIOOC